MPSLGKRSTEWIDLTGDDDENPPLKQARRLNQLRMSQPPSSQSLDSPEPWRSGATNDEEEDDDIIDLSQDVDEGFGWTCIGAIHGKIVGIRYYDGYATPGEQVMVRREPGNPYDPNAIRINVSRLAQHVFTVRDHGESCGTLPLGAGSGNL